MLFRKIFMKIVIPMAGSSERYKRAGFALPKYLLPVGNKTMIEKVVETFNPAKDEYIFIISKEDEQSHQVKNFLSNLPIKHEVYEVDRHNLGPTHTALQIKDKLDPKDEVIINYCDFLLEWDYQDFLNKIKAGSYDGGVPCFKGFHPASLGDTYYAYLRVNEKNEFLELREKQPFTDNRMDEFASTGTYYFKTWEIFCKYGKQQLEQKVSAGNKEFYPSLIYNLMQADGLKSLIFEVEKFICLGSPKDYQEHQYWFNYFKNL